MGGFLDSNAVGAFFPFVLEFGALTLLYRYLPNARVHFRPAAIAAAAVTLSLEVLRALFGFYVRTLSRVNLITGSLTLILLMLISIYLFWALILLGVELTHVLQTGAARRQVEGAVPAGRAENAIRMLLRLARGGAGSFRELSDEQQAPTAEAQQILECLTERGFVEGDATRGYTLARRPARITVAHVVEAVSPNLFSLSVGMEDRITSALAPLFQRLEGERRAVLGTTLADLMGRR
jgi:membrane protein